jgi:murein DD-endopeptidase MepM/ murein hydrolase activator NlpD
MRKPFNGDFRISQEFGKNLEMYKKFGYLGHNGIDWACPIGTPILAPHDGTVKEIALDEDGYGWYVKIENETHGSVLGHNQVIVVKIGDHVTEGQQVAVSGNTGWSTGPHCHWGLYPIPRDRANGYGGFIDQINLLLPISQNMTTEEQNILNFLKLKKATEGMVREAFGALADIPNIQKKLSDLEKSYESLTKIVEELRLSIGEKEKSIASVNKEMKVIMAENERLVADNDYYKPYKSRYEEALTKIPNAMSGWDLIIAGVKRLKERK